MRFDSNEAWLAYLNDALSLSCPPSPRFTALDLFAGCGGLALGFEAAGFETLGYEMDANASETYRRNLCGDCIQMTLQKGVQYPFVPDVIIGGPPCQPFSVIGNQRGRKDSRDGFPIFIDAVSRLSPKLAIIENVRGLLYQSRPYLDQVVSDLKSLGYTVDVRLLKATDQGVPQNRERLIIVATQVSWSWPKPSVSHPVTAGVALGCLAFEAPVDGKYLTPSQDDYIAVYEEKSKCINPRDLHLDKPARTLTCRNFGGSTSDMHRIKLPDGRRRMLRVQEGARLQSFPDRFEFTGREASVTKQIGNAVPPLIALALAQSARLALSAPPTQVRITGSSPQLELAL